MGRLDTEDAGSTAIAAIIAVMNERQRQVEALNYQPERDDTYTDGELARAGAAYALSAVEGFGTTAEIIWPWHIKTFKPAGRMRRRNLVKAAALIIAEIERLDRATEAL